MPLKKLENLLKSGAPGSLDQIIRTANDMDSLTGALRNALAPEMADQLVAANARDDGILVIICSSSAWASRIRFESESLLSAAKRAGFSADSVRVSVRQG
ncbi:MAG: DciA family protein [Pseudomonadota bacterium]|nr:DciA family protein [Pseudomonadota bacterium]